MEEVARRVAAYLAEHPEADPHDTYDRIRCAMHSEMLGKVDERLMRF